MNPNGTFNYLPPTGFVGVDSFNYTISDSQATDSGTVTIVLSDRVWYVNPSAAGPQTGRSTDPFATIGQAETASAVNDFIHVAQGVQTTGITLKDNQRLVGSGVPLVVGTYTLTGATVRPTLGGTIDLASGNLVTGLNVTGVAAIGIAGNSVSDGVIDEVGISSMGDGLSLANVGGSFQVSNSTISPGGRGIVLTGSADVSLSNVAVSTSGMVGIFASGSGLLSFNGGTVASTNATALDLSNHALGGTGLISVSASNAQHGIRLLGTSGVLSVLGTGAAGSGGTISGMSGRGIHATNAEGLVVRSMTVNGNGMQGVLVDNNLTASSVVEVTGSSFNANFSNGVQTLSNGSGSMSITIDDNVFVSHPAAVVVQTTSGPLVVKVRDNTATFNSSNAFNVVRNNTGTGIVEATITGNAIGAVGIAGSGATCGGGCSGIVVSAGGTNAFRALVADNDVRHVDANGIRVFASGGSSALAATVTNNTVSEPEADALFGIQVQSGTTASDTTSVCAHLTGNVVSGLWTTDIAVRNFAAGSTFSLPGYAGLGTDTTAVANFITSQNTITSASATRKTTVPANQFSGGPLCVTPAP